MTLEAIDIPEAVHVTAGNEEACAALASGEIACWPTSNRDAYVFGLVASAPLYGVIRTPSPQWSTSARLASEQRPAYLVAAVESPRQDDGPET
ncbi:hypothetical protein WMF45_08565 [Sorangium sp. So ce448]|uniref:hypothetical protein n=1 Tax=Sorangium sp. So ce448 TaxID=3133314 RepID=UPI003F5EF3C5